MIIQDQLSQLGIQMKIIPCSDIEFIERMQNDDFDAYLSEFCALDDPDLSYMYWHSSQQDRWNWTGYASLEADRLLEQGRMTLDEKARKSIYHKFQQILVKDIPAVFLFWPEYLVAVHQRFGNIQVRPVSGAYLPDIENWIVNPVKE